MCDGLTAERNGFSEREMSILSVYMRRARPVANLTYLFLAIFTYLVVYDKIDFSQWNKTSAKDLSDYSSRLRYVIIHLTPGISWVIFSSYLVITKRMTTPAINPLLDFEDVVTAEKNNLTNSIEQFLMSAVSQLILVIHLKSSVVLKAIPALNLLFIIGRIAFWLGYPNYRTFGICVSSLPVVAIAAINLYEFALFYCQ